jgi:serine/threonine protein kinase
MTAQRYQIIERIAAGGMAEVYRGESSGIEGFRKKVAIKRVLPKLSQNQEFIDMFLDEARLCAYLNHSKCVQVFDIGQGAGSHFIVMEYVDGADLKGVLDYLAGQRERMSSSVACLIAQQVCEGLGYAHDAVDHAGQPLDIVHRDISPHNVLMTRFGEVKLVDFGLARASSHLTDEDEDIVKGKFGYLAPEVTRGQGADRRVDIFAAGILLWEMLAGRRLFHGSSDLETFKLVQAAVIPDIRSLRPDVSPELHRVLMRALAADPNQRYPNAHEFARDLSRVFLEQGDPVTYQDLAAIVGKAAATRSRERRHQPADHGGILGDVIIDALHEFSNLTPEPDAGRTSGTLGRAPAAAPQAAPGDFIDPSQWGFDDVLDDFLGPRSRASAALTAPSSQPAVPARSQPKAPEAAALAAPQPTAHAPRPAPPPGAPPRRPTPAATHRSRTPVPAKGPWWKKWWG